MCIDWLLVLVISHAYSAKAKQHKQCRCTTSTIVIVRVRRVPISATKCVDVTTACGATSRAQQITPFPVALVIRAIPRALVQVAATLGSVQCCVELGRLHQR